MRNKEQMINITKQEQKEVADFARLLKQLDVVQQAGLLSVVQGLRLISGQK